MSGNSSPQVGNDFVVARPNPVPARIISRPSSAPVMRFATASVASTMSLDLAPMPSLQQQRRELKIFERLGDIFDAHTLLIFILLSSLIVGLASQVGMSYWNNHMLAAARASSAANVSNQVALRSADGMTLTIPAGSLSNRLAVITARSITIGSGGKVMTADQNTIRSWLTTNTKGDRATIAVNASAITASVKTMTSSFVSPVIDQVTTDHGGTTAPQQIIAGKDGTELTNGPALTQQIAEQLLKGQSSINLAANINPVAFRAVTPAAFDKLLEADVTTKTLYAYQNGQLVQTFLASTGKASTPTPIGEFHIWSKLTKHTMRGPGYVQPNVPYISYFDHSGDAVHGVYWRPASVFGSVNTSHGCVGLQVNNAKWVYDWAPIGTTVITHA